MPPRNLNPKGEKNMNCFHMLYLNMLSEINNKSIVKAVNALYILSDILGFFHNLFYTIYSINISHVLIICFHNTSYTCMKTCTAYTSLYSGTNCTNSNLTTTTSTYQYLSPPSQNTSLNSLY